MHLKGNQSGQCIILCAVSVRTLLLEGVEKCGVLNSSIIFSSALVISNQSKTAEKMGFRLDDPKISYLTLSNWKDNLDKFTICNVLFSKWVSIKYGQDFIWFWRRGWEEGFIFCASNNATIAWEFLSFGANSLTGLKLGVVSLSSIFSWLNFRNNLYYEFHRKRAVTLPTAAAFTSEKNLCQLEWSC